MKSGVILGALDRRFEKVALLEVPLFNAGSAATDGTLFQKRCAVGEMILIGKRASPLFFPDVHLDMVSPCIA